MMVLPSQRVVPATTTVGYFEADPGTVAELVCTVSNASRWKRWYVQTRRFASLDEALNTVRAPVPGSMDRTELLLPVDGWTALLNNAMGGTDLAGYPSLAAERLGCRAFRAVDSRGIYPAVMLEEFSPRSPLVNKYGRSIAAANDGGRWVFDQFGEPYPFEELERYTERRKRDRFTPEMLERYLLALGVPADKEPDASGAILVKTDGDFWPGGPVEPRQPPGSSWIHYPDGHDEPLDWAVGAATGRRAKRSPP